MQQGKSMTAGTPWKLILAFMVPVLLGSLLQQLYNTADAMIVGKFVGEDPLSAVGTTGSFGFLFLALAMGFSNGCGVVVAQHYGAKDEGEVRKNASAGIVLILSMGIVSTIVSLLFCRVAFASWIEVPEDLLDWSVTYFMIYAGGLIFQFGYNIIASILRAVGDSKATLYFLLIASVVNVILDLLFVAVFQWGVGGAAFATDLSQIVACASAYIYMVKKYPIFRFKLKDLTFDVERMKVTLRIGFPMALQLVVVSLGFSFIQRAVNSYGKPMMASFTVAQRMETYMNMPAMSFQTALATYTGQNIGAKQIDRVKQGMKQTIVMSILLTIAVSALIALFAQPISGLFGISGQAVEYCTVHLRVTALCMLLIAIYFPLFGLFQGSGHGEASMLVAIGALAIRVLVTYTLCNLPAFGHTIIWWNQAFGFAMGCTIAWVYYFSGRWKKSKSIVKEEEYEIQ